MKYIPGLMLILAGAIMIAGGAIGAGAAGDHYTARETGTSVIVGGVVQLAVGYVVLIATIYISKD